MKNKCLIVCNSITYAQKIISILNKNNYFCSLIRTPSDIKLKACSYSVVIHQRDLDKIISLLEVKNIKNIIIYKAEDTFYIKLGAI